MPSQTFYNLSSEKQETIIKSAIHEFTRVPFAEASINKIIKTANISRGSFYTYFEDKYDLLFYLLEKFKEKITDQIKTMNEFANGNLKELMILIHKQVFDFYQNETIKKFLSNIIIYFHGRPDDEINRLQQRIPFLGDCENLYEYLDLSKIRYKDKKQVIQTIDIAFATLKNVLFISSVKSYNYQESKKLLEEYLEILEKGYMEEEKC
jgi:AcrR family transcriptional regulator